MILSENYFCIICLLGVIFLINVLPDFSGSPYNGSMNPCRRRLFIISVEHRINNSLFRNFINQQEVYITKERVGFCNLFLYSSPKLKTIFQTIYSVERHHYYVEHSVSVNINSDVDCANKRRAINGVSFHFSLLRTRSLWNGMRVLNWRVYLGAILIFTRALVSAISVNLFVYYLFCVDLHKSISHCAAVRVTFIPHSTWLTVKVLLIPC